MSQPNNKKMLPFPEMWEAAKQCGQELDGLAETFYEQNKTKLTEEEMFNYLSILAKIYCMLQYLDENKISTDDKKEIEKNLKNHKHVNREVVFPLE